MKETRILMGMTITVEVVDSFATTDAFKKAFSYFEYINETFSTYKDASEISRINSKKIGEAAYSNDMRTVLTLAEKTKKDTNGYFDIVTPDGRYDPSGIVKGWAIYNVSEILRKEGLKNFYINAGGDIAAIGRNGEGGKWSVGIRSPFNPEHEVVKVVYIENAGVATSGSYIRGHHIYNPHKKGQVLDEIVSITIIGPNVYEADRFATAAFAMGRSGIDFVESLQGFEGYMIDAKGKATMTSNFNIYTNENA